MPEIKQGVELKNMKVTVHLVDGSSDEFLQEDTDIVTGILKKVNPMRFYQMPELVIESDEGVFAYPMHAVEYLEMHLSDSWPWKEQPGMTPQNEISLISEEEFNNYLRHIPALREKHRQLQPGDSMEEYGEIELQSGKQLRVSAATKMTRALDQRRMIHDLFRQNTIVVRCPSGGIGFINVAAIMRVAMYPGPISVSKEAWALRRR